MDGNHIVDKSDHGKVSTGARRSALVIEVYSGASFVRSRGSNKLPPLLQGVVAEREDSKEGEDRDKLLYEGRIK